MNEGKQRLLDRAASQRRRRTVPSYKCVEMRVLFAGERDSVINRANVGDLALCPRKILRFPRNLCRFLFPQPKTKNFDRWSFDGILEASVGCQSRTQKLDPPSFSLLSYKRIRPRVKGSASRVLRENCVKGIGLRVVRRV
jgi:hypothetical protein